MRVRVKLFAIVKERAGAGEVTLELPEQATVAAASAALKRDFPEIAGFLDRAAFAVNREYVDAAITLPCLVLNSRPSSPGPNWSRCSRRMATSSGGIGTTRGSSSPRCLRPRSS